MFRVFICIIVVYMICVNFLYFFYLNNMQIKFTKVFLPIKGLSFPFLMDNLALFSVPSLSPFREPFRLSKVPIRRRRSGGMGRGSRSDLSRVELAGVMRGSAGSGSESASTLAPTDTCSSTILRSFACKELTFKRGIFSIFNFF